MWKEGKERGREEGGREGQRKGHNVSILSLGLGVGK